MIGDVRISGEGTSVSRAVSLRELVRHGAVYGLGSVLDRAISFLMIPIYTRFLNPADYGIRELIAVSVNVLAIFLSHGIKMPMMRFYRDDDGQPRPEVVSTAIISGACFAAAGVTIGLALSTPLARLIFASEEHAHYLRLGVIALFFTCILELTLAYVRIRRRSTLFTVLSLARLVTGLALNLVFLVVMGMGLEGIFYSDIIATGVIAIALAAATLREVGWSFSAASFVAIARYGAATPLMAIALLVINTADRMFLARHGSLSDVGVYSLASQFAQVLFVLLIQPFLNVWGPSQFEVRQQQNGPEIFLKTFHVFVSALLVCALGLSLFSGDVVRVVAAPAFHAAGGIVPLLAVSYVFTGAYWCFAAGTLIRKRTEFLSAIAVVAAAINVALNAALIPSYGTTGAATARTAAMALMAALAYVVSQRLHPIRFGVRGALRLATVAVVLFIVARLGVTESLVVSLLFKGGLVVGLAVAALAHEVLRDDVRRALASALVVRFRSAPKAGTMSRADE